MSSPEISTSRTSSAATRSSLINHMPLGTLSVLPRELRDQVYGNLSSNTYCLNAYAEESFTEPQKWCGFSEEEGWSGARQRNLAVMKVCKAMREEFIYTFFRQARFEIDVRGCDSADYAFSLAAIPFVPSIRTITFSYGMNGYADLDDFPAEPLSVFTSPSTSTTRDMCTINLYECSGRMFYLPHSPFLRAVGELTAFKTVRLVFYSRERYWRVVKKGEPSCWGFDTVVEGVSEALAPTLGPFVKGGEKGETASWTQYLTFHPQRYQADRAMGLVVECGMMHRARMLECSDD